MEPKAGLMELPLKKSNKMDSIFQIKNPKFQSNNWNLGFFFSLDLKLSVITKFNFKKYSSLK